MRLEGLVKTRQISWDLSVKWGRERAEPENLLTDSRKQKILLVRYISKGKPTTTQHNQKRRVTLAPEIREVTLMDRECLKSKSKEPVKAKSDSRLASTRHKELMKLPNTGVDLAAIGSSVGLAEEKSEECVYCHMKGSLGTNHNKWCRKLFSINKLYTQYNLSLASRWKPPKGFSGKKQARFRHMEQNIREGTRRTIEDGTPEPEPISPPPPQTPALGAISPIFPPIKARGWEEGNTSRGGREIEHDRSLASSPCCPNLEPQQQTGNIPRASPLPFKTDHTPENYTLCVFCHANPLTKIDQRNCSASSENDDEIGRAEINNGKQVDTEMRSQVLGSPIGLKPVENPIYKEFRDSMYSCNRVLPSPVTPPPPPTPVIGTGPIKPAVNLPRAYCYETNTNIKMPSKAMQYKYTMNGSYFSAKPMWHPQAVQHKSRGDMFKPHPPLKCNKRPRTLSPGCEVILERLGLKFKVPCPNQNVLQTKSKQRVEPKPFLGKPGRFLPPIANEDRDSFQRPLLPL